MSEQARAAVKTLNPQLDAARELFDDVIEDPLADGMNPEGFFRGLPFMMKDLGPSVKGRLQEMGSLLMRGNRADFDS
ncbi:MAG: amidase, partial [Betaproteobacteria bacterium]|nr:amidase [Betaproteobacteria bacterium]